MAPLAITPGLTSGFGEYRDGRFHAGIDYSTESATGRPVRAIADGWVWRVRASGVGYGRSVYFRLEDGRTAVFAHLSRFAPTLESYVAARQDSSGEYEQDLYPPEGRIRFKAGEILAWSGESGAGPPHLHFEMRRGDMNLNPLTHGFAVPDRTPPAIVAAWLMPAGPRSRVAGGLDAARVPLGPGKPIRATEVRGPFHLTVETWDRVHGRPNRLATYRLSATLDGAPAFEAVLDSVSWDDMTEADMVFDYRAIFRGLGERRSLTRLPSYRAGVVRRGPPVWALARGERTIRIEASDEAGNRAAAELRLMIVADREARGDAPVLEPDAPRAGSLLESRKHSPPIAVTPRGTTLYVGIPSGVRGLSWRAGRGLVLADSLLTEDARFYSYGIDPGRAPFDDGWLMARGPGTVDPVTGTDGEVGLWHVQLVGSGVGSDSVTVGRLRLAFDPDTWFEPTVLTAFRSDPPEPSGNTDLVSYRDRAAVEIAPESAVLRRATRVELSLEGFDLRPRHPDAADRRGLGLYVQHGGGWSLVTSEIDSLGRFVGTTRRLGTFAVLRDTVPPVIVPPRRYAASAASPPPGIGVTLRDRGAGLSPRDQKMFVDGRRVPAEYDPDADRLTWHPRAPLSTGTHTVRIEAVDRLGNRASTEVPLEVR